MRRGHASQAQQVPDGRRSELHELSQHFPGWSGQDLQRIQQYFEQSKSQSNTQSYPESGGIQQPPHNSQSFSQPGGISQSPQPNPPLIQSADINRPQHPHYGQPGGAGQINDLTTAQVARLVEDSREINSMQCVITPAHLILNSS